MSRPSNIRLQRAGIHKINITNENNILKRVDLYYKSNINTGKLNDILPSIRKLMNQTLQESFYIRTESNIQKFINKFRGQYSESFIRSRFSHYIRNPPYGTIMNCIGTSEAQCAFNRQLSNGTDSEIIHMYGNVLNENSNGKFWFKGSPHLLYSLRVKGLYIVFDLTNRKEDVYYGTIFVFETKDELINTMKIIYGLSRVNFVKHENKPNCWHQRSRKRPSKSPNAKRAKQQ